MITTDVLIVGAGPVGLTLAIDLGRRGVRTLIIERKPSPQFLPKMERCNARTMEIFRRLQISNAVRAAGLRAEVPMDVYVVLALDEPPLLRLPYASVEQARAEIAACRDGTMPLEPYQLISQYTLEPLLKAEAERLPSVAVRFDAELISFVQDEAGVQAAVVSGGVDVQVRAKYLVGCDGGTSTVRHELGIALSGEANLQQLYQALYHCPELFDRIPIGSGPGHGRHYHVADTRSTFLIMQDSTRHWTLHAHVDDPNDMATQFERTVGVPVRYETLFVGAWKLNLLLADRYQHGRVFLAGDAAHLVIPTGGLGMNSGVGDAIDLGWKLAGTLHGWGGPGLLASYEAERRPVGAWVVDASRYAFQGRRAWRAACRDNIRDATPEGRATRAALARVASVEQPKSNEMIGAELGYRYVDSPIIVNEPGGPEPEFRRYVPSTSPGARLPHVWIHRETGALGPTPIQDLMGEGFTLLRLGGRTVDTSSIERAMAARGVPLTVQSIPDESTRDLYGRDLLLVRPDLHVAWRGNRPPEDAGAVAARVSGH